MTRRRSTRLEWTALLIVAVAGTASLGFPQGSSDEGGPVLVHDGFGTGQTFLDMSEPQRRAYAMGVVNGLMVAPLQGAPKDKLTALEDCLEGMTGEQVAAIIAKYLSNHPERWHRGLHLESWLALKEACNGE